MWFLCNVANISDYFRVIPERSFSSSLPKFRKEKQKTLIQKVSQKKVTSGSYKSLGRLLVDSEWSCKLVGSGTTESKKHTKDTKNLIANSLGSVNDGAYRWSILHREENKAVAISIFFFCNLRKVFQSINFKNEAISSWITRC